MTEVPDYLLQRSRERRGALGLLGGARGAGGRRRRQPVTRAATCPAPTSAARPHRPAAPSPSPPGPRTRRRSRRRPTWGLPCVASGSRCGPCRPRSASPSGATLYAGHARPARRPRRRTALAVGDEVYGNCASCHGAGGEGGCGLHSPRATVRETFADPDHPRPVGLPRLRRLAAGERRHLRRHRTPVRAACPRGTALTPEEPAVIAYERAESVARRRAEGLVDEEGNLLVAYDEEIRATVDAEAGTRRDHPGGEPLAPDADVLVVGGGPAGAACCVLVGRAPATTSSSSSASGSRGRRPAVTG